MNNAELVEKAFQKAMSGFTAFYQNSGVAELPVDPNVVMLAISPMAAEIYRQLTRMEDENE